MRTRGQLQHRPGLSLKGSSPRRWWIPEALLLLTFALLAPTNATSATPAPPATTSLPTTPQAKLTLHVDVLGGGPPNAKASLQRHLQSCLAPEVTVAPLLVALRWSRVGPETQVIVDVTWGAVRLGARLLRGRHSDALIEAAAVASCVALDQALSRPSMRRRALRRAAQRTTQRTRRGPEPHLHRQADKRERQPATTDTPIPTWRLHIALLGAVELAPAPTSGVTAALSGRRGVWSGRLDLRALVPAQMRAGRGDIQSSTVGVVASICGQAGPVALCPLMSVGVRLSSSAGLDRIAALHTLDGEYGARLWLGSQDDAGIGYALYAEATLPWVETRLRANDVEVWRRAGAAFSLGVELTWSPG